MIEIFCLTNVFLYYIFAKKNYELSKTLNYEDIRLFTPR